MREGSRSRLWHDSQLPDEIGTGMGEQMLSREYYYLGTQLPIDRFLTFYYGHPGFHINNMLVILSVQIFILTSKYWLLSRLVPVLTEGLRAVVFLGTLNGQLAGEVCRHSSSSQLLRPTGCYNLTPHSNGSTTVSLVSSLCS